MTPTAAPERLTDRELAVWRSLLDTTGELRRLLSSELQRVELSTGDYAVLLALTEAADRTLRSSELADAIDWERSRVSHHLGRMEKRGLIRRTECPGDNRGALVVLTEDGYEAIRRASGPHLRAVKRLFADALRPDQLDALAGALESIQNHLDRAAADPDINTDTSTNTDTTEGHRR
ncbi:MULTISPECIES: MarR family winged helix-turn-helix transcriptional regulator [unclassified Leifsonia]|uniref:MarR family winged helix-turn-helix transcriptional regulator n=1 Tax=unclassified Leifsonia TaxID=2663824 RepID=UPI0005C1A005|nr:MULTISPECIES: MarR family transcriptional regulator [unclassified Leifsonia]